MSYHLNLFRYGFIGKAGASPLLAARRHLLWLLQGRK